MQSRYSMCMSSHLSGHGFSRFAAALGTGAFILSLSAAAQNAPEPKETIREGYAVHQSIDVGGRIADQSGSLPMYDTLVNLHSGSRIFQQSLEMHAVPKSPHFFLFDNLMATN